jgi:hypothetical protein
MQFLRANTQVIVTVGPFVDVGDGFTPQIDIALSGNEAELLKHGSTTVVDISGATWAAVANCRGYYSLTLTASHTNTEGLLVVIVQDDSDCLPVKQEYMVLAEAAYDSMFVAKDDGFMDVNIKTVGRADTQEDEANNLESACSNYSVTRGLTGTALPAAAADAAGGVPISDAGGLDMDSIRAYSVSSAAWGSINSGAIFRGTVSADDPGVSFTIGGLAGQGAGAFVDANTPWYAYVFRDGGGAAAAPQGEVQKVTGYTTATGLFTTDAFTAAVATGDDVMIVSAALINSLSIKTRVELALPNAAPDAAGGLPISDAGGLDLDAMNTAAVRLTAVRAAVLTDWIDGGRLDNLLDAILVDTGTTLPATLATIAGYLDTEIAAIKAVTDNLPDSGALTTIGTDTARLTAARAAVLTDWIDGGRLDLLLDAIKVITDALTAAAAAKLALSASTMATGTVSWDNTNATTTVFYSDDITEATADHYNGRVVLFTSGVLVGQATDITDYALDTGEGKFTVTALTEAPADNVTFIII